MQEQTPQALLRDAAVKIETALVKLDMREQPCGTCGHRHFENRTEAKVYEQFSDTARRLTEAAERIDQSKQMGKWHSELPK